MLGNFVWINRAVGPCNQTRKLFVVPVRIDPINALMFHALMHGQKLLPSMTNAAKFSSVYKGKRD
jgi:hypothetical protein